MAVPSNAPPHPPTARPATNAFGYSSRHPLGDSHKLLARARVIPERTTPPLGITLAAVAMRLPALARAVPIAVGVVVLIAGAMQLSTWKAHHLGCCREEPGRGRRLPADAGAAWRHGLRLGLHCTYCSAGLMAILLVIGVMDPRAMAVVAAAITVERLAPRGERVAGMTGAVVIAAGVFLIVRAAGLV